MTTEPEQDQRDTEEDKDVTAMHSENHQKIVCPLFKVPLAIAKELNPMIATKADAQGWIQIKGVMDSGASESVAPPTMCPHYDVVPSEGSMCGQEYMSASNDTIRNLGEQVLDVVSNEGVESKVKYQIADVSRPLNSITEICDAGGQQGQVVIFGRNGGAVVNLETGNQTPFQREDGVYVMSTWVKPKGFPRQGW